jgi:hypothetical protein
MYHSPGLRDGVTLQGFVSPPCLPAIHRPQIVSVGIGGFGINSGHRESCSSSAGLATRRFPGAIAEKFGC